MKRTLIVVASISLAGCAADGSMGSMNRPYMEPGIFIGAAGGALLGAAAYKQDRTKGAIVGAIGGGIAGGAVGAYMDNQKKDLEKNLEREIKARQARVDKLQNNIVRVTMTSDTGFATNSADIRPGFNSTMDKIADVVKRYGKTTLTIAGHTDDVGSNQYNQGLSERRALSVARYFESRGVQAVRLATVGKGETMPIDSNSTEGGRSANRRVEIYVEPVVEGS
ncbi:MAG TPA: OmpA family protein [Burkholderiales bacterium]|nr:OmpA family protein [Burkholderiales bacterium]